jgi:twitching motility protein PilT
METDDLNRLIRQLNEDSNSDKKPASEEAEPSLELVRSDDVTFASEGLSSPAALADSEEGSARLKAYLGEVVARGATDLLLVPGTPPTMRVHGTLVPFGREEQLGPEEVASFFLPALSAERRRRLFEKGSVDLAISLPSIGRFRINLHKTRNGFAASLRLLPRTIPSVADLGLPDSIEKLARLTRGLVLVTGPAGCGKSTTLAALVESINRQEKRHIISIEDPIEYEHFHGESIVEQIEVGTDSITFADALRSALRQDPDVILVGEMRDLETISTALTAAETGHLVLTTLHTNDAVQSIHRLVDVFPAEQQPQIRQQLSMALTAIVYQTLIVRKSGRGRVVACEVLIATDAVRNHIRKGNLHHLRSEITLGRKLGMMTLEDSLAQLVRKDLISETEARIHALHLEELESFLKE